MTAGELCTRIVVITRDDVDLTAAAQRMRDEHVGALVVVMEAPAGVGVVPIGILTDRDLVLRVLAEGRDPAKLRVGDVMTIEIATVREDDSVSAVLEAMKRLAVRRMPVVDERGALIGILTLDDMLEWLAEEAGDLVQVMRQEQVRERVQAGDRASAPLSP